MLARDPKHLGANHYYIHAVEASKTPERALSSAKRLHTLAPAAGHLVHMPAHILQRTGDYAGADLANENGARADRELICKHGPEGVYPLMYEAAIGMEDALNYDEPSDWFYPIRETLGAALLRAGRYDHAATAFEADLERNAHNPRSLWRLAEAQKGRKQNSSRIAAEHCRRWKGAALKLADF